MGYCKCIKASTVSFTFFNSFGRNFFPGRYEKLFWQEFYLVSLPLFPEKEKISPLENWIIEINNWNMFYGNYHFLYWFLYQFFLSWQCPGPWSMFIDDLLYFQTFLKVALFSAIFSDKKLLLKWIWQQIALRSNCLQTAFRSSLIYLLECFFFTFVFCNKD